ncbi:MAG TPA: hypothetical protein VHG51_02070 [Longimicrobiaceae bacterium]|nr:hypothetical protein [Longimicrobiaceae bacterium]
MSDPPNRPSPSTIPEDRALAALRRAAQLQAEATERVEAQTHALAARRGDDPGAGSRFRPEDIEAAAAEAGIPAEFVRQALQEQETLGEHAAALAPWMDRMGNRLLRTRQRSLELSREIEAEPQAVLDAMQRVFPAHPYAMTLVDSLGPPPLEGGVLVFQLPRASMGSSSYTPFGYVMTAIDLLQVHATLQPVPRQGRTATLLTLRGDLRVGIRRNVWAGLGLSGGAGAAGLVVGTALALASGGVAPLVAAGAALGAAGMGGAALAGYGTLFRYYFRKALGELETLLRVVDANARTGGAFRSPVPPQRDPALLPGIDFPPGGSGG